MSNMQTPTYRQRVHAEHCCRHGCKYGDENCPVVVGEVAQTRTCHDLGCDEPEARSALDDAVSELSEWVKVPWAKDARAELAALRAQLATDEKLLAERNRLLAAIPACPEHGAGCVPHAIEWVEKAKETRTVGTALTMLAQREHDARLAKVEAELLRLGALVALAPTQPRTCATCRFCEDIGFGLWSCESIRTPRIRSKEPKESFGCIHHAPLPPGG